MAKFILFMTIGMFVSFFGLMALEPSVTEVPKEGIHPLTWTIIVMGMLNGFGFGIGFLAKYVWNEMAAALLFGAMAYLMIHMVNFLMIFGSEMSTWKYVGSAAVGLGLGAAFHIIYVSHDRRTKRRIKF